MQIACLSQGVTDGHKDVRRLTRGRAARTVFGMTSLHKNGAVLAMLLLAAAGCATPRPVLRPTTPPHTATPRAPQHVAATKAPVSVNPTGSAAAAGAARAKPPTAPETPPPEVQTATLAPPAATAPPPPLPGVAVVGLPQTQVRALLGPPATRATHGPVQTWTYRGSACAVEISFYYDVTRSEFFALSQRAESGGDAADCLAKLHASAGR
jgi:hypothetical protein